MKLIIIIFMMLAITSFTSAYGHKLITHDDTHRDFDRALKISDHRISWAIYENLGANEAKFYTFDAKQGEQLYVSIVIPKISGLENYSPTLVLVGEGVFEKDEIQIETDLGINKFPYEGEFPGKEFYEPFGQITYWERQEIKTDIPLDGEYFIIVMDEKNQIGKYSLAIGTIEDFSGIDFFTILPWAWFETKIFVEDYIPVGILLFILMIILSIPIIMKIKNIKDQKIKKS